MSKFKKGDRVVLLKKPTDRREGLEPGSMGTVHENGSTCPYVKWDDPKVGIWAVSQSTLSRAQKEAVRAAAIVQLAASYQQAIAAADAAEQARKDALAALVAHIEEEARK